jgi:hypothetical protein
MAKQIAENRGIDTAVLLCNFALQSSGLRFASRVLGVSRRTIYRRFRGRFGRLRSDGEALRDFYLSHAKRLSKRRVDTEGSENALSLQTNWMPKVALRLQAH